MGAWGTRFWIVAYKSAFPNCSITALEFPSELLCLWIKKERHAGSSEMISDSLARYPAALGKDCSAGCEMPFFWCRIGTAGCGEPYPAQPGLSFSLCPCFSWGNNFCSLFCFLMATIGRSLNTTSVCDWETLRVLRERGCFLAWGLRLKHPCTARTAHRTGENGDPRVPSSPAALQGCF